MTNSLAFFGMPNMCDSSSEPNSFMYALADVVDELNRLLGTIRTEYSVAIGKKTAFFVTKSIRNEKKEEIELTNRSKVIGKAKIVDDVQRLQVIDKLFSLFFLSQESVLLVQCSE